MREVQDPTLTEHFSTLAESLRSKASNEQKASNKTELEQLASCYARLAEEFKSAAKQAPELPKP